jgi:hypothetical protein
MICEECQDEGHYWFAEDDVELDPETEKLIGIYAWCDQRQVFSTLTGCECGCHNKNKGNENIRK